MDGGSLQGAVPAEGTARVFVEAKDKAIEIMSDMEEKVNKVDEKLSEFTERGIDLEIIEDTKRWCTETNAFFNKGKMKVVVFGSTSSGKSTTVNAILHERVLESGMGHVTNCIFQIQGSKDKKGTTFKINKGTIEEKIEDLKEYLLPGSNKVLDCDSVVYITCPIADGSQISPDVIIVDCPGLDKSDEHDEVLFNHCKDADVFVFVADAKIGIRKTELSFFKTIENPTVFVLFNCWDSAQRNATDRERAPYVRGKHGKDALEFLKTTNQHFDESKNRIYFVSAEEYLEKCEQERAGCQQKISRLWSSKDSFLKEHEARWEEFQRFEKEFWTCTTSSAIQTRFAARISKGKQRLEKMIEEIKTLRTTPKKRRKKSSKEASLGVRNEGEDQKRMENILSVLKTENITKHAKSYSCNLDDQVENFWQRYIEGLYSHVGKELNKEIQEIDNAYKKNRKDMTELDRKKSVEETGTRTKETSRKPIPTEETQTTSMGFDAPPHVDPTYKWSIAPFALMKKMLYPIFYKDQPTTSSKRALLQIGGFVGSVLTGAVVSTVAATMTPVVATTVVVGASLTGFHYQYDKSNWTKETKQTYLQDRCVTDIANQLETRRKKLMADICKKKSSTEAGLGERNEGEDQKKMLNILNMIEIKNITKHANSYRCSLDDQVKNYWQRYNEGLYSHMEKELYKEIQEMNNAYEKKDMTEVDRKKSEIPVEETGTRTKETSRKPIPTEETQTTSMRFDAPPHVDPTYKWSIAPFALMKKMLYPIFYKNQPTTTSKRALLQIGGFVGSVITGAFVSTVVATMTPVVATTVVVGASLTGFHYQYDKSNWTKETIQAHLQDRCVTDIEKQVQTRKKKLMADICKSMVVGELQTVIDEMSSFQKQYHIDDSLKRAQSAC